MEIPVAVDQSLFLQFVILLIDEIFNLQFSKYHQFKYAVQ